MRTFDEAVEAFRIMVENIDNSGADIKWDHNHCQCANIKANKKIQEWLEMGTEGTLLLAVTTGSPRKATRRMLELFLEWGIIIGQEMNPITLDENALMGRKREPNDQNR